MKCVCFRPYATHSVPTGGCEDHELQTAESSIEKTYHLQSYSDVDPTVAAESAGELCHPVCVDELQCDSVTGTTADMSQSKYFTRVKAAPSAEWNETQNSRSDHAGVKTGVDMLHSKYFTRQKLVLSNEQQQTGCVFASSTKPPDTRPGMKRTHVKVEYGTAPEDCQVREIGIEAVKDVGSKRSHIKTEPVDDSMQICGDDQSAQYVFRVKDEPDTKKEKKEPPLWQEQLSNIFEMRKFRDAPVDSMGCDVILDRTASPKVIGLNISIIKFSLLHFFHQFSVIVF